MSEPAICADCAQYGKCMAGQGICVLEDTRYLSIQRQLAAANRRLATYAEARASA